MSPRVPAMMPLTHRIHRAKLLSFLLCGVLCPVHAFAVRTRTRPVSSPAVASRGAYCRENRLHLIIRGSTDLSTNHSNKSRSDTVLSVASGGADGPSNLEKFMAFTSKNFFLLGMVAAVSLARAFPHLGRNGGFLRPELFIGKYGVTCIFLLSGLSLELSELSQAIKNVKLNGLTQFANFALWPLLLGLPVTKGFEAILPGLLPTPLLDGILIMTCLPTTVNMCIILATAAGGNAASALCNAVIGNIIGIFVTPALLLRFLGTSIDLPFVEMILKLCNKVLVPVAIGQGLRTTPMKDVYSNNSKKFKRLQEYILLGIVWNAFCNAFTKGMGLGAKQSATLLVLLPTLHLTAFSGLLCFFTSKLVNCTREDAVSATFCASQKTLAFGLPLISTLFEGNPNLAAYSAPIMLMHPTQLILGSILVPKLRQFIMQGNKGTE